MGNNLPVLKLKDCDSAEKLKQYSLNKGKSHKKYKKYATYFLSKDKIDNFVLNDGCLWDDSDDAGNLKNRKNKVYAMCFCCQESEDYSLWKAYTSGENSDDAAILDLPRRKITKIISEHTIQLFDCEGGSCELKKEEYDLYLADIIYKARKINDRYIHRDEYETLNNQVESGNGFLIKNYEYVNEKECRLVLEIKCDSAKYKNYHIAKIFFDENIIEDNDIIVWSNDKHSSRKYRKSSVAEHTRSCCNEKNTKKCKKFL